MHWLLLSSSQSYHVIPRNFQLSAEHEGYLPGHKIATPSPAFNFQFDSNWTFTWHRNETVNFPVTLHKARAAMSEHFKEAWSSCCQHHCRIIYDRLSPVGRQKDAETVRIETHEFAGLWCSASWAMEWHSGVTSGHAFGSKSCMNIKIQRTTCQIERDCNSLNPALPLDLLWVSPLRSRNAAALLP